LTIEKLNQQVYIKKNPEVMENPVVFLSRVVFKRKKSFKKRKTFSVASFIEEVARSDGGVLKIT